MSFDPDDVENLIDAMILNGMLEFEGIDMESGQIIFHMTEKMREKAPALYQDIGEAIHQNILSLWEKGLLSMNIMDESPMVAPTEAALDRANWADLDESQRHIMNTIMRAFEGGI